MPRNHHCIFVETHEDGPKTGYVYQVTGNIQTGMIHEHRKAEQPEISNNFGGLKRLIGTVPSNNYVNIRIAVNSIPPPKKQFDGPKKIYPNEPLRRCQEWTNEAIQTLIDRGILQLPIPRSPASSPHWIYSDKCQRHYHTNEDGKIEWAPEASGSACWRRPANESCELRPTKLDSLCIYISCDFRVLAVLCHEVGVIK